MLHFLINLNISDLNHSNPDQDKTFPDASMQEMCHLVIHERPVPLLNQHSFKPKIWFFLETHFTVKARKSRCMDSVDCTPSLETERYLILTNDLC